MRCVCTRPMPAAFGKGSPRCSPPRSPQATEATPLLLTLPLQTPGQILWMLVILAAAILIVSLVNATAARLRALRRHRAAEDQVRAARETGLRLADGIASPDCGPALVALIDGARDIAPVATGLAQAARTAGHATHPEFFDAVERSRLPRWARSRLRKGSPLEVIDAIEIIEALRIESLFAELAEIAASRSPAAFAAADAAGALEDHRVRSGAGDSAAAAWGLPAGATPR